MHFKKNSKLLVKESTKTLADFGYQGIKKIHNNSQIPKQNTKKNPLTEQEKKINHQIISERVPVENEI